jgi:hypothetical protein
MSGNGGDNAHNNAFGGGKNPGIGNSGSSGSSDGSGGSSGGSSGGHFTGPAMTIGPNGEVRVNFSGYESNNKPSGNGGGNGGSGRGQEESGTILKPDPERPGRYISLVPNQTLGAVSIDDNSTKDTKSYTFHTRNKSKIKVTVPNGNIDKMTTEFIDWKGPKFNHKVVKRFVITFMEYRKSEDQYNEKDALLVTSSLITDMGEKIGGRLGEKYKLVASEIANNIRNFQGKTVRTHQQAMESLNKILANPGMKINKGDKDALINAWKSFKADDTAKKLGNLSRAFKVADIALKTEKVRQKSIHGYETGDWGPLMLEVESWILSGMAAGVAIALFGAILSMLSISGLALTAITIIGIMAISYLSSKIDAKIADKINKEVIRPAN